MIKEKDYSKCDECPGHWRLEALEKEVDGMKGKIDKLCDRATAILVSTIFTLAAALVGAIVAIAKG